MTSPATTMFPGRGRPAPDKMETLVCSSCRMRLYISERELQKPTWRCPACGAMRISAPQADAAKPA